MATNPLNIDVHFLHRDPPVRVERHGANQQLATIYVDVAAEDSVYPVRLTLHGSADRLRRLLVDTLAKLDEAMQPDLEAVAREAIRAALAGQQVAS